MSAIEALRWQVEDNTPGADEPSAITLGDAVLELAARVEELAQENKALRAALEEHIGRRL